MPEVILSKTSRRHCVSNSATSRNKGAVYTESSDMYIEKMFHTDKYTDMYI